MRRPLLPTDEQLHAQLRSAPELSDGLESLSYWHDRRQQLSWYRIRARREASQMIMRWEDRLREAILSPSAVPVGARLSGGLLIARTRMRRWKRRAVVGARLAVGASLVVIALPLIALLLLVFRLG